jgi:hypothetical protein
VIAAACSPSGAIASPPVPPASPTVAVEAPGPAGDLVPVSISNPSPGAADAFAKCHLGDQYSFDHVAGMGQVPTAMDLLHYVPLNGREPQLKEDGPAWVIQFRGDLPMRDGFWTDPICVVTAETSGFYATGPTKGWNMETRNSPEPPSVPPDRTLPPLIP